MTLKSKSAWRKQLREVRTSLTWRQQKSAQICDALNQWMSKNRGEGGAQGLIFSFCPLLDEPDISSFNQAWRQQVLLPRTQEHRSMEFYPSWQYPLERGALGVMEPAVSAGAVSVMPKKGDLMLVPALAIDDEGYRLGYGGGYYDRYLARVPEVLAMGVVFEELRVESLPRDEFDQKLDAWVTERGVVSLKVR